MNAIEIILLNFSEIRRRSIKIWEGIPDKHLHWQPDKDALSIIEMIRHVLEGEHLYHKIIEKRGRLGNYMSPWQKLAYSNLNHELDIAKEYRKSFIMMLEHLSAEDLKNIVIERKAQGQKRKLGDYLNRIAYHEAVHQGQMLGYLRTLGVPRPIVWD